MYSYCDGNTERARLISSNTVNKVNDVFLL